MKEQIEMLSDNNAKGTSGLESLQRLPFYVLVILGGYLTYLVLGPFLAPLIWAAVFAIVFHRMQVALSRRMRAGLAALVTTVTVAILIVAPGVVLVSVLALEVPEVADHVQKASLTVPRQIEWGWEWARTRSAIPLPEDPTQFVRESIQRVLTYLAPRAMTVVADFFATLVSLITMLFALFFMLRDGDTIARELRTFLPLPRRYSDRLMAQTRDLVIASVGAGLVVAVAQGTIGGVAFWLLGIKAPALWGVVIAFCSLIPVVGALLVWGPFALWLLLSGDIARGVIMVLAGALGISMADNVLRPLLLSGKTALNGLVVFFGLLGGMAAFGFLGLVLGPIILVVTGNLLKMFTRPDLVEAELVRSDITTDA